MHPLNQTEGNIADGSGQAESEQPQSENGNKQPVEKRIKQKHGQYCDIAAFLFPFQFKESGKLCAHTEEGQSDGKPADIGGKLADQFT